MAVTIDSIGRSLDQRLISQSIMGNFFDSIKYTMIYNTDTQNANQRVLWVISEL